MVFEVIESIAGMVGNMLSFPVAGMLGQLLPAGGSEAGQQVATAVGTGLDNLGSLCSQTGLDRWELLGLAVLSAITVYRKELSSNSVYHGKKQNSSKRGSDSDKLGSANDEDTNTTAFPIPSGFQHAQGCPMASYPESETQQDEESRKEDAVPPQQQRAACEDNFKGEPPVSGNNYSLRRPRQSHDSNNKAEESAAMRFTTKPCPCLVAAAAVSSASTSPPPSAADQRRIRRLVEGRMLALNLPVNHLQQLRASVDKSWSSLASAWETRRSRGSSGVKEIVRQKSQGVAAAGSASNARGVGFVLPPCTHVQRRSKRASQSGNGSMPEPNRSRNGREILAAAGSSEEQQASMSDRRGGKENMTISADQLADNGSLSKAVKGNGDSRSEPQRLEEPTVVTQQVEQDGTECPECAALLAAHAVAHAAAVGMLLNGDGTMNSLESDNSWASSSLGVLPSDALHRVLGFLGAKDLVTVGQVSMGGQEAVDDDLVWRKAWMTRFGSLWESGMCRAAARRWHFHEWNPRSSSVPQGWKTFYSEFEATWLEWIAAGQNSESSCVVGLYGRLYDITEFIYRHPGSPETLMDNAGADATEIFEDVGHSNNARDLMKTLDSLAPSLPPALIGKPRNTQVGTFSIAGLRNRRNIRGVKLDASRDNARCVLSCTAKNLMQGRTNAIAKGKELTLAATLLGTSRRVGGTFLGGQGGDLVSHGVVDGGECDGDPQKDGTEFRCSDCGSGFDPADEGIGGATGRSAERHKDCAHASGTLRVFYVPMRAEWGGFYSCCRKHVLLSGGA